MNIPTIMVLDRDPDSQDEVLNIDYEGDTMILHALMDVTVCIMDPDVPSGTLRFKAGQVIVFPFGAYSNIGEEQ